MTGLLRLAALRLTALREFGGRHTQVWAQAWSQRHRMPVDQFTADEAAFLPAALSLREAPLSPAPRVTVWLLLSFAAITLVWSLVGRLDVVVVAQGRIVGAERSKTIAALDTAQVARIAVQDGQFVRSGDVLIELDTTASGADVERLLAAWQASAATALRHRVVLASWEQGQTQAGPWPAQASGMTLQRLADVRQLADGQLSDIRARQARLLAEVQRRSVEVQTAQLGVERLEMAKPWMQQASEDYAALALGGHVPRHAADERQQRLAEHQAELMLQKGRLLEARAALSEAQAQTQAFLAESRRTLLEAAEEAEQRSRELSQELDKARGRHRQMALHAPVDGVVQQLAVFTVGGVVTPGAPLMVVVPQQEGLLVEASVENKDIGFVHAGQSAAVKVETFAYTKYGLIEGQVIHASADAVADEQRGLVYTVQISLPQNQLGRGEQGLSLGPGMAVSVEIKTGSRRVIEYFLSPLLQYGHESLRER